MIASMYLWARPEVLWPIAATIMVVAFVGFRQWRKVRQTEIEAGLKLEMVRRGLSVDEIERVVQVSPGHDEVD